MENEKQTHHIVVIGSINYDILMRQETFPKVGETVLADDVKMSGGGKGANQAVQAVKLGARVTMVGAVGEDVFGDILLHELSSYGVETRLMKQVRGVSSGLGLVNYLPSGELLSNVYPGANMQLTTDDIDAVSSLIQSASMVVLQTEIALESLCHAISLAHANQIPVMYNAAPAKNLPDGVLEKVDYLIMNEAEAEFHCRQSFSSVAMAMDGAKGLQQRLRNTIVVTLGPQGALVVSDGTASYIPPVDVPVVETTGAGDSFVGALAVMMSGRMPIIDACNIATCASSLTIQKPGGQIAMPTLQEVTDLYTTVYKKEIQFL